MHLMPNWLTRRAAATPDALALITPDQHWSFAELEAQVNRTARQLLSLGVQPGDRVAVLLKNGGMFAALVHAMPRLGSLLLPLNIRLSAAELLFQLQDAGARCLIYDPAFAPMIAVIRASLPQLPCLTVEEFQHCVPADAPLRETIDLADIHCVIYTSGTTGRPKGAMLSYGNHWWSAIGSVLNLGLLVDDRWLAPLPFFHVGGMSILMRGAIYGIAAVVPASSDPTVLNQTIAEQRVTIVSVVSTLLQRMLDAQGEQPFPASLRCVLLGGGPAPRPLLEACAQRELLVSQTYGLTETASQVVTLAPRDALRKLGSAGQPLLPNEIRITSAVEPTPAGEVGEILVRGPSVMRGYLNRPDETQAALRDGWLHTGDLGYLDDEGFLFVIDRRNDLIISGGENIYPAEVEAVLLSHPAITDAGVIGASDPQWGQVAVAFVVAAGLLPSLVELQAYCAERLARYKIPRAIFVVDSLPRNAAGKLVRGELRAQYAASTPKTLL